MMYFDTSWYFRFCINPLNSASSSSGVLWRSRSRLSHEFDLSPFERSLLSNELDLSRDPEFDRSLELRRFVSGVRFGVLSFSARCCEPPGARGGFSVDLMVVYLTAARAPTND